MEKFRDTKALIVDLRCYPREFMIFDFIGRYFMPRTSPHVIWLAPTGALPGVFHELQDSLFVNPDNPAVTENPDYYKGRVIVLVDSSTQSQAEYTAMAFQATPRCTVVGTQTAGADGNISALVMPGGDFGYFSGLGGWASSIPTARTPSAQAFGSTSRFMPQSRAYRPDATKSWKKPSK